MQRIDWAFLDAVKFALDMPEAIKSLLSFGAGLPLGSIYGLGTSNVRFVKGDGSSASNTSSNTELYKAIAGITSQASGGSSASTERSGLQFMPYLTDIGNWAKIFSGGNATLFTYELPLLEFDFVFNEILASVPIPFPPLSWISIDIGAIGSVSRPTSTHSGARRSRTRSFRSAYDSSSRSRAGPSSGHRAGNSVSTSAAGR